MPAGTVADGGTVADAVGVTVMKARVVRVGQAAPWQVVAVATGVLVLVASAVGVLVGGLLPMTTTALLQVSAPGAQECTSTPSASATFTVLSVRLVVPSVPPVNVTRARVIVAPFATDSPVPPPLKQEMNEFVAVALASVSAAGFGGPQLQLPSDRMRSGLQAVPGAAQAPPAGFNDDWLSPRRLKFIAPSWIDAPELFVNSTSTVIGVVPDANVQAPQSSDTAFVTPASAERPVVLIAAAPTATTATMAANATCHFIMRGILLVLPCSTAQTKPTIPSSRNLEQCRTRAIEAHIAPSGQIPTRRVTPG